MNPRTTHLLIRHQEIALKGKNRPDFEHRLRANIRRQLGEGAAELGEIRNLDGRMAIEVKSVNKNVERAADRIAALSGVAAVTPCRLLEDNGIDHLTAEALEWANRDLASRPSARTFAVRARRVDKRYPMPSAEVDFAVGSQIKRLREDLTVSLTEPEIKISIEIRRGIALIYSDERAGARGLPMDATQRVVCLLSGGIDSPVAAYEVMRRGCAPILAHFHSMPFTSEAAVHKVKRLAGILRGFSPFPLELWLIPLLEIQKAVRDRCNERHRTIHYRRFMMRIAEELAARRGANALVTGDALGQVASQTLTNMAAIEDAVSLPVLRPLVSWDKDQIVSRARGLGTFEVSVLPHEDSCVLFAPAKPATRASLPALREETSRLPAYGLVFAALDGAKKVMV